MRITFFGVLYVPPSQSKFLKDDEILALEMEILSICSTHKYVFLTGDINARTGKLQDFITVDTFFADFFEFDNETLNFYNQAELLKNFDISVNRTSCDNVVNTNGSKLIEICRGNNLFIVNGRLGTDRDVGHFTYRNTPLIDYTICTLDAIKLIHKFDVIETDTLFSDGHSALSWSVKIAHKIQDSNDKHSQERPVRWKPDKANSFVASINAVQIQNLVAETENMEINQDRINNITDKISEIFNKAALQSFGTRKCVTKNKPDKPWFGEKCRTARFHYHKARKRYSKFKTTQNKQILKQLSKQYKTVMNQEINRHKFAQEDKLRNMQTHNPKDYWKYINSLNKKQADSSPPAEEFFEYYKNINAGDENDASDTFEDVHFTETAEELNNPISAEEIQKSIRNLKNGKAYGGDEILNEYIKASAELFLPLYVSLFNKVLCSGIIPQSWLDGYIKPIF